LSWWKATRTPSCLVKLIKIILTKNLQHVGAINQIKELTDIALLLPQSDCEFFSIKIQLIGEIKKASKQSSKQAINQSNQSKINQKKSKSQSN